MTPTEYNIVYLISGWCLGTVGAWILIWIILKLYDTRNEKRQKASNND